MTTHGEAILDAQRDREIAAMEGAWRCPFCEWVNTDDAHNCQNCFAWRCENCGRLNAEEERLCLECAEPRD